MPGKLSVALECSNKLRDRVEDTLKDWRFQPLFCSIGGNGQSFQVTGTIPCGEIPNEPPASIRSLQMVHNLEQFGEIAALVSSAPRGLGGYFGFAADDVDYGTFRDRFVSRLEEVKATGIVPLTFYQQPELYGDEIGIYVVVDTPGGEDDTPQYVLQKLAATLEMPELLNGEADDRWGQVFDLGFIPVLDQDLSVGGVLSSFG